MDAVKPMTETMTKSSWQRKAPLLLLLAVAGVMAVATWYQMRKPSTIDTASPARQAPAPASPSTSEPVAGSRRFEPAMQPAEPASTDHPEEPVSAQEHRAQKISALNALDREFQRQPRSATWGSNTEQVIAASLSESGLAANQAPVPIEHDAECRTSTCRIHVTYANEMDAQMGEVFLLGDIARQLPSARLGRLFNEDGTVELVIYADTGKAVE